jgi:hypothetical protein
MGLCYRAFPAILLSLQLSASSSQIEKTSVPQIAEIRAGELTLLIGNEYDHGAAREGYIGIWRLTSIHEPTNIFVPQYAGWIHRRNRATVKAVSADEAIIQHLGADRTPNTKQIFRVIAPYYFDCTYSVEADGEPVMFNGTSYINGSTDPGIYFLDPEMRWQRHYDSVHGSAASLLADGVPVPKVVQVSDSSYPSGAAHFRDSFSESRYHRDYALFYGRFRDMVLVHMFPPASEVIPYMSPRGGGVQPDGKRKNPAWDWRILITKGVDRGNEVQFTMRTVFKKFVDNAEILQLYRKWATKNR